MRAKRGPQLDTVPPCHSTGRQWPHATKSPSLFDTLWSPPHCISLEHCDFSLRTLPLPKMAWGQGPSIIIAPFVVVLAHWYASQSALACFYYETAFVGDDLNSGVVDAESAEECQEACQKNADCAHWTYDGEHRSCHLKGDGAQNHALPSPLAVSGPRYCTLPSQCVTYGVEFNSSSSDVDRIEDGSVPNPGACHSLCAQHLKCIFWTYFPTSKNCYLKGQGTDIKQQQSNAAAISGRKNCPPPTTLSCFQADMDYVWDSKEEDTVYYQGVGSAKECQKLCQLDPACHVFTYIETSKLCALGKTMRYSVYKLGATTGPKFCIPPASTGENIEIFGKNLATHRTPSHMACQLLCESSPLCSAATYNTKSRTCVHKQTARFDEEVTSGPKLCKWLGPFPQSHRAQLPGHTATAKPADNPNEIGVGAAPGASTEVHMEQPTFLSEGESLCTLHGVRRHYIYKRQQHMYSLHKVPDELRQPQSAGSTPPADHAGEGCFHKGVEILGRDVGTGVAEGPAACQRMCRENQLCSVFAYYTSSMLCVQRQRARWMPGLVSFEKQVRRRGTDVVEPLFQEDTNTSVLPVENKCFSSGFQFEEAVLVSTTKAESAEGCQMLCQKESSCSHFTYSKNDQRCGLLESRGRKVPKKDSLCGPKFCDLEAHTQVAREDLAPCFLTGYFYDGLSLKHMRGVVSAEDCQRYCQRQPLCTAFSYIQKQLCRLHVDSGDLVEDPDAIAGPRACPSLSERTFDGKADLSWGEARSSTLQENVASAESCREACAAKPSCDVFTYSTGQRRCLLHSGHRTVEAEESWTAGSSKRENFEEACGGDGQHNECAVYAYRSGLTSTQECQKLCETEPSCKYSTFYEKGDVRSRPQQVGKLPDDNVLFEPQFNVIQDRRQIENCLLTGACSPEDVPAVAFNDHVSSAQECERLCEDNPLCTVFTYATVQQTCKLHTEGTDTENDTAPVPRTPLAGLLTQTEGSDCFNHGFYYDGMALASRTGVKYAKECQWLCQVEPQCKFFSYFIKEQMCGLLSEQGNKVEEADAVCGPRICPLKYWEAR